MNGREPTKDGPARPDIPHYDLYSDVLNEAEDVRRKSVERLHHLCDRFPSAVPAPLLDQLDHARLDPRKERRTAVRFDGGPRRVSVRAGDAGRARAEVVDRSVGGLKLRVARPHAVGSALTVRLPCGGGRTVWYAAAVRYCRRSGDGWEVGCEFQGARPGG
jgi:hypothetical protein